MDRMNQMSHSPHKTTTTICACGKLHFTYGAIPLRFDPDEFLAFAASIGTHVSQLRQALGTRHRTAPSGAHDGVCH